MYISFFFTGGMGGPGNQTHYPGVASAMLYLQRTIYECSKCVHIRMGKNKGNEIYKTIGNIFLHKQYIAIQYLASTF